ncbi:hypothetical protein E2C01_045636 [Portunus trituberculatus]|uniref:Uncharacterized protein n=1 Tax=Portunus trituberculatus TaxID=210409 RepID=A0A5B7FYT9_PORTR|nr:hypothetical protein [Portunus trituberculatus]
MPGESLRVFHVFLAHTFSSIKQKRRGGNLEVKILANFTTSEHVVCQVGSKPTKLTPSPLKLDDFAPSQLWRRSAWRLRCATHQLQRRGDGSSCSLLVPPLRPMTRVGISRASCQLQWLR